MANPEQGKQELDKQIDKILSDIKEQEDRLSELQSSGFQLASYYLVFQGVILMAIARANTVFRCLPYWLLIVLSVLAALPNLVAMDDIGKKYRKISNQRDKFLNKADDLNARLDKLAAQLADPAADQAAAPAADPAAAPPAPPAAQPAAPPAVPPAASPAAPPAARQLVRSSKGGMLRVVFIVFCLSFYAGVSAIISLFCVKSLRKPGAQC